MLSDPSLSLGAKGLYIMLVARPAGTQITMKWVESQSASGREATRSAVNLLIEHGYLERTQGRSAQNQTEWHYRVVQA